MSSSEPETSSVESRIADVLLTFADVAEGAMSARLSELPDTDAFGELYRRINQVLGEISSVHARGEHYRLEILEHLATIEEQREAMHELSTPVIEVYEGLICLPILGVMDSARCSSMTDELLSAVVRRAAKTAILDVTGIELIETATLDHFVRMAKAVQLLGTECVITGISPGAAQTIVSAGLDLGSIRTFGTMRDALRVFVTRAIGAKFEPTRARVLAGGQRP